MRWAAVLDRLALVPAGRAHEALHIICAKCTGHANMLSRPLPHGEYVTSRCCYRPCRFVNAITYYGLVLLTTALQSASKEQECTEDGKANLGASDYMVGVHLGQAGSSPPWQGPTGVSCLPGRVVRAVSPVCQQLQAPQLSRELPELGTLT